MPVPYKMGDKIMFVFSDFPSTYTSADLIKLFDPYKKNDTPKRHL